MMMTFSEIHQPQPLKPQNQSHNQRRKKLNQLPSQSLSSTLKSQTLILILMLWPRKFWKSKLMVWFGTTNQRRLTSLMESKNSKWVVSLKMPKSLLTTSSNQSNNGKKSNPSIWLACKNCD